MKILVIADEESKFLWDFFEKSKLEGIDLIISCGDLDPRYLSFLVTLSTVPVLYVNTKKSRRKDALALKTRFMSMKASVSLGSAAPCAISRGRINTPNGKCGSGWPNYGSSFSESGGLTS